MTATIPSRLAGKALFDFLKTTGSILSGASEQAALRGLSGAAEAVDAPGLLGKIASGTARVGPENVARLVGAATPLAVAGSVVGGAALARQAMQPSMNAYGRSSYSLPVQPKAAIRQPAFATQQYVTGVSPMTNEQMGEALLDQQRFQHQLELIKARHETSNYGGSLRPTTSMNDIIGLGQKIYG